MILIFTLPETLFSREGFSILESRKTYVSKMFYWGRVLDRRLKTSDFINAFRMAKYTAVYLPSIFFATSSTYCSVLFAVTGASIASKVYHYNTIQTGLLMGLPLTVGCTLGEASAGWISDLMIDTYAKRHRGYLKPEVRLWLIPLCLPILSALLRTALLSRNHAVLVDAFIH